MVILVLLVLTVTPLLVQVTRFFRLSTARLEIQRDARNAMETLNRLIRQAVATSVTIDQASGQPARSRITFTGINGTTYQAYQQNHSLMISDGSTRELSKHLRFIAFSYPRSDNPNVLSMALTMEAATYEGQTKVLEFSIEKVRVMN
jgi:hypothetical protein